MEIYGAAIIFVRNSNLSRSSNLNLPVSRTFILMIDQFHGNHSNRVPPKIIPYD